MADIKKLRTVDSIINSIVTKEGAGFIIHRPFPTRKLDNFDPFLLLDHAGPINYGPGEAVGAPWHPHRGFETVGYILQGELQHRDSMGNKGILRAGDVQWMTAGSGIIHDEIPSDAMKKQGGDVEGFQIWVNLPKKDKMCPPAYQDVSQDKIPRFYGNNFEIRVVAGEALGVKATIATHTPIIYLDVHAKNGAEFILDVPDEMNALVYIYRGQAKFGAEEKKTETDSMVTFKKDGNQVKVKVDHADGVKFLLLAGIPLNEPIARYGPFVMNTSEEIEQAFEDYQTGKLVKQSAEIKSKAEHKTEFNAKEATIV